MTGPGFLLRMAWRESRASRRRLWLLTGALSAGVAALVAINSFTENLKESVRAQAQALLGADLALTTRAEPTERVSALIDTLVSPPDRMAVTGTSARVVSFSGMAYVPRTDGVRLVQVQAVEGGYPYYGTIETDPAGAWAGLQAGGRVLVDPSLLPLLGAHVGDSLSLGSTRFVIGGTVRQAPGNLGLRSAFGPPVWIAYRDLSATELLRFGSRGQYEIFVKLPAGRDAQDIAKTYRPVLRPLRVGLRTVADDRDNLTDALTRMGNYLGLVALIALLLGGLGVASAIHVFIKQKLDTIAILRCLGASAPEVLGIYLLQAMAMGGLGSIAGAVIGLGLQQVMPMVLGDLLPVNVAVSVAPQSLLIGVGLGLWVSLIFALVPLLSIRHVSPLVTLRRDFEKPRRRRDPIRIATVLVLALTVVGLAGVQTGSARDGLVFSGGIAVVLGGLWVASRALIGGVRRWFPRRAPYLIRQGLANLYRPANQTVTVVLALGFGAFLLSTLFLVQHNLLRELRVDSGSFRPNLAFFDIQVDQKQGVERLLAVAGVETSPLQAIVPMRLQSINGKVPRRAPPPRGDRRGGRGRAQEPDSVPADSVMGDSLRSSWATRREYRSTYRDSLVSTEKLVEGAWWDEAARTGPLGTPERPVRISVEQDVAEELGVAVGDTIVWDVQGAPVTSEVASLREVNWARMQPNFFVVFEPGALERAPQMLATLARIEDPTERGQVQRNLAEAFPNVTSMDLSLVQDALQGIIDRVAFAIRFMAGFSLATGAIVLIGAVATSRFQRLRESVLLKTLGASRGQVLQVLFVEYAALGTLATLVSVVLASAAAWALAKWVFETSFALPRMQLGVLTVALVALTLLVGFINSVDLLRKPPLEVLRNE